MTTDERPDENERPCKKCGMKIRLVVNAATGSTLPLQKIRTVYRVEPHASGGEVVNRAHKIVMDPIGTQGALYVSHFETCPSAGSFGRKKR